MEQNSNFRRYLSQMETVMLGKQPKKEHASLSCTEMQTCGAKFLGQLHKN